ncbi:MAG: universal stress protein [Bacteroidetes bacterium]|nr:universal stress protein [Bacteroidota bacterium]
MKKIICPVDFSKASINAVEYAEKLTQIFAGELLFINVQRIIPITETASLSEGFVTNEKENSIVTADRLKALCMDAIKKYNISATYAVEVSTKSLAKNLAAFDADNTMIVMGTNGADEIYQYFFGTDTFHVLKSAKCPVLVIPENYSYRNIKKIVFAWDYSSKSKFSFSFMADFMKAFNPQFIFLHVSKHHTEISLDVFRALHTEIESVLGKDNRVEFEQIFSDNIPESINDYMIESNADVLSITYYNRGLIPDLFHGTVAKELSEIAEYPILVLHA